ncbi:hypothetical protein EHW66_06750, partial [Erwinia psidii]|nr:hypothetical protein [Erwinia psidii]MCX8964721.1 hypothetical protein [Erwinia psidii]
ARSVKVNAALRAGNNLAITTGRNTVNAANTKLTKLAGDDSSISPKLALDVTSLGGMYAGAITLVGTEHGVGVKNAGELLTSAGAVRITADGDISNSGFIGTNFMGSVTLNGTNVSNTGKLSSSTHAAIIASGDVVNSGYLNAYRSIEIEATGLLDNSNQIISNNGYITLSGGNIDNSGDIYSSDLLIATSKGDFTNSGILDSAKYMALTSNDGFINTGTIASQQDLIITAADINSRPESKMSAGRGYSVTKVIRQNTTHVSNVDEEEFTADSESETETYPVSHVDEEEFTADSESETETYPISNIDEEEFTADSESETETYPVSHVDEEEFTADSASETETNASSEVYAEPTDNIVEKLVDRSGKKSGWGWLYSLLR